jgi:hypothetical protein
VSDHELDHDVADVLGQVVELGSSVQESELGDAVSRHVSNRTVDRQRPDDETVAALRALANPARAPGEPESPSTSPLSILVDFNDLLDELGEPDVWSVLGKLKDLFG